MTIGKVLKEVEKYYEKLEWDAHKEIIIQHLISLSTYFEGNRNYPKVKSVIFPKMIDIAYAVCDKECDTREFIVEGSTHECQNCGGLMYGTRTRQYRLISNEKKRRGQLRFKSLVQQF